MVNSTSGLTAQREQGTAHRSPLSSFRADHSGPVAFTGVTAGNLSLVYWLHRNPSQCCASDNPHQNLLDTAFTGSSGCCFATGSAVATGIAIAACTVAWVTAGLNCAADNSWYAASHRHRYLARHAFRASHRASLTHLTADSIRHLAGAGLLSHRAGCVRNLLGAAL